MTAHVKTGGAWAQLSALYARVAGSWVAIAQGWVKVGGTWTQFYSSAPPSGTTLLDTSVDGAWSYTPDFTGSVTVELWGAPGGAFDSYAWNPIDLFYDGPFTNAGGLGGYSIKTVAVTNGVAIGGSLGVIGNAGIGFYSGPSPSETPGTAGGNSTMTSNHTANGGGAADANLVGSDGGQSGGDSGSSGVSSDSRVLVKAA